MHWHAVLVCSRRVHVQRTNSTWVHSGVKDGYDDSSPIAILVVLQICETAGSANELIVKKLRET